MRSMRPAIRRSIEDLHPRITLRGEWISGAGKAHLLPCQAWLSSMCLIWIATSSLIGRRCTILPELCLETLDLRLNLVIEVELDGNSKGIEGNGERVAAISISTSLLRESRGRDHGQKRDMH